MREDSLTWKLRLVFIALIVAVQVFARHPELIIAGFAALGVFALLVVIVDGSFARQSPFTAFRLPERLMPSWIHAVTAALAALLLLLLLELYFESVPPFLILFLGVAGLLPAFFVVLRHFGILQNTRTAARLPRLLAERMVGRSEVDMAAGALAALAGLINHLDNQSGAQPEELCRRIKTQLPAANEEWLLECADIALERLDDDIEQEILALSEFYASLVSAGRNLLEKKRLIDWSLGLLYSILAADGTITAREARTFRIIASHFGIRASRLHEFRRKAEYDAAHNSVRIDPADAARKLFGLGTSFTRAELDHAWKRIVRSSHPDRFHFSDPALYREVHEKFLNYQKAYELLRAAL